MHDDYRYWAFLSYSSRDQSFARKLHRRLETYRIPRDLVGRPGRDGPTPTRLFPVFRDRDELPLSSDLGGSIEGALRASRYLIVLCSPDAAASRWVNEEIRYYKSLGRTDRILALILDGEPNASDRPGQEARECFPLALRHALDSNGQLTSQRVEPVAGDIRKSGDGWQSAFLKAVAGVTGMGYDAFKRREQRRQRTRRAVAGAAGMLALFACLWLWDYNRVKVSYYANLSSQWGVPAGVSELDTSMRKGRFAHYRFESRRGKVRVVRYVNSAGTPDVDVSNHGAALHLIVYRESGSIERVQLRDNRNRLVMHQVFSELEDTPSGKAHYVQLRQEQGMQLALESGTASAGNMFGIASGKRSEISAYQVTYDSLGRVASRMYRNAANFPRATAEGVFGVRFSYDGNRLLATQSEYLDASGHPAPDWNGTLLRRTERRPNGDYLSSSYFAADGSASRNSEGCHRVESVRDNHGNELQVTCWLGESQRAMSTFGYHKATRVYDHRGNVVEDSFWDADERPVRLDEGFHKRKWKSDSLGNRVEMSYWSADDRAVSASQGFHRGVYSKRGDVEEATYWSSEGRAILHSDGYHKSRTTYEDGYVHEGVYWGVDGQPTFHKDGFHKFVYERRGNVTEESYWGINEAPVLARLGYHKVRTVHDERGNRVELAYFGPDNQPVMSSEGFHVARYNVDEQGQETETTYWGTDGGAVLKEGVHRLALRYSRGEEVEQSYWGKDGEPVLFKGFHKLTREFDDSGIVRSVSVWDLAGRPTVGGAMGIHKITGTHDGKGQQIEESYWATDGSAMQNVLGYHRNTIRFDAHGRHTELAYWGVRGQPVSEARGCHRQTLAYDARDNQVETICWGVNGEPALLVDPPFRYHRVRREFDERGHTTLLQFWGTDRRPLLQDSGVWAIRWVPDERGNRLQEAYWGIDGRPTVSSEGYHMLKVSYDDRGNPLSESYWDTEGRPALQRGVCHMRKMVYDERGLRKEESLWGPGDEPMETQGTHRAVYEHDVSGKLVATTYLDRHGSVVARESVAR